MAISRSTAGQYNGRRDQHPLNILRIAMLKELVRALVAGLPLLVEQPVADTRLGRQVARALRVRFELLAQAGDVDVQVM